MLWKADKNNPCKVCMIAMDIYDQDILRYFWNVPVLKKELGIYYHFEINSFTHDLPSATNILNKFPFAKAILMCNNMQSEFYISQQAKKDKSS